MLGREQRMAEWVRARGLDDGEELSFGKWLRGIVSGDWRDADNERRALQEGTLAGGGYTVPTPLAAEIIDRARNIAAVMRAGARTVPMTSQTQSIARVASDPTASWKAENAVLTDSDMTFEEVELSAKTLVSLTRASRELIEDSVNAEDALRNAFAEQLAISLDRAALYGTGTAPEPRGVKNTTGVTTQSQGANGAALGNYDPYVTALQTLWTNNFQGPFAVIEAPRTAGAREKLKDSTAQPLRPPPSVDGTPFYVTNQVPTDLVVGTSTNSSDAFVGDWRELLIGVRHGLEIEVLKERYADAFQLGFLAHLRADVAPARPAAFVVITGIVP